MPLQTTKTSTSPNGLITEFSSIAFPENATIDELNCVLSNNGKLRQRRLGFKIEDNAVESSFTLTSNNDAFSEYKWENVGGIAELTFAVIQTGSFIRFYDLSSTPLSAGEKSFSINLSSYAAGIGVSIADNYIEAASLDGALVIAHKGCNLLRVLYDSSSDTISVSTISPNIRDFTYIGDKSRYATSSGSLTDALRRYDTLNSGWSVSNLATFTSARNRLPVLTHYPWTGKDTNDVFSVSEWSKQGDFQNTGIVGNGTFILNYFTRNRNAKVSGAGVEVINARFSCVAAYAGRFFYAGLDDAQRAGSVLFTRVIKDTQDYVQCYQQADPTSEIDPLLVDSDGGEININEAYGIKKLFPYGQSLIVFAENGIWSISGSDDSVFRASGYIVTKLSSVNLTNKNSFVNTEGTPFWWGDNGIYTFQEDRVTLQPSIQNISEQTIKKFFNSISPAKRRLSKAIFDEDNRDVYWLYPSNDETIANKFNKVLVFNLDTVSFTPWEIKDQAGATSFVSGGIFNPLVSTSIEEQPVLVNGEEVTVGSSLVTLDSYEVQVEVESKISFTVIKPNGKLVFGGFIGRDFLDWGESDYTSYFIPTPVTMDSWVLNKSPLFLYTYFERTETAFIESDGDYNFNFPSACDIEVFMDDASTPSFTQSCYRLTRPFVVDEGTLDFNYPFDTIVNRTRLRGRGKVMKIKFKSQTGKDFRLQGYELLGWLNEGI